MNPRKNNAHRALLSTALLALLALFPGCSLSKQEHLQPLSDDPSPQTIPLQTPQWYRSNSWEQNRQQGIPQPLWPSTDNPSDNPTHSERQPRTSPTVPADQTP